MPRASGNTRFFSHQGTAAGAARIPFAQQQRAMEQGAGRAPAAANLRGSGASAANPPAGASAATRGSVQNDRPSRVQNPVVVPLLLNEAAAAADGSGSASRAAASMRREPRSPPRRAEAGGIASEARDRCGRLLPQSQPQYRGNTGGSSTAPSRQSAPQYRALEQRRRPCVGRRPFRRGPRGASQVSDRLHLRFFP